MRETPSGYKTTEFWITLVTVISGMLFILGVVGPDGRDTTAETGHHTVESVSMIAGLIGLGWQYLRGRQKLKEKVIDRRKRIDDDDDEDCDTPPKPKRKPRAKPKTPVRRKPQPSGKAPR